MEIVFQQVYVQIKLSWSCGSDKDRIYLCLFIYESIVIEHLLWHFDIFPALVIIFFFFFLVESPFLSSLFQPAKLSC